MASHSSVPAGESQGRGSLVGCHLWGRTSWTRQAISSSSSTGMCMVSHLYIRYRASQVALVVKNLPANAGDIRDKGLIPGSGRSPGGGHGNPLSYCLENPMDKGASWAMILRVTKIRHNRSDSACMQRVSLVWDCTNKSQRN